MEKTFLDDFLKVLLITCLFVYITQVNIYFHIGSIVKHTTFLELNAYLNKNMTKHLTNFLHQHETESILRIKKILENVEKNIQTNNREEIIKFLQSEEFKHFLKEIFHETYLKQEIQKFISEEGLTVIADILQKLSET